MLKVKKSRIIGTFFAALPTLEYAASAKAAAAGQAPMPEAIANVSTGGALVSLLPIVLWILLLALVLFVYFIPAFVAKKRNHLNKKAILILNIFLGWTFIGYVVALVWACTNSTNNKQI